MDAERDSKESMLSACLDDGNDENDRNVGFDKISKFNAYLMELWKNITYFSFKT